MKKGKWGVAFMCPNSDCNVIQFWTLMICPKCGRNSRTVNARYLPIRPWLPLSWTPFHCRVLEIKERR